MGDLENFLPPQVLAFAEELDAELDPLTHYLQSGQYAFKKSECMPLDDFKKDYLVWRNSNNHPKIPWTSDHYQTVFECLGLTVEKRNKRTFMGEERTGAWIVGLTYEGLNV